MADNGKQKKQQNPSYVVARVDKDNPNHLTVIEWEVEAKHQDAAMDKVVEALPREQQKAPFAAFLRRGYVETDYDIEEKIERKKTPRKPGGGAPTMPPTDKAQTSLS